uniref:Uncharacterized protein n=1 Tax=Morchella importuna TaxID=1174673 RepID=A0A650AFS4_9PEZI|nr:hypothetical protein [Morchella importuna]QGN66774.1 hypothetical protein [Morchella importuna]
MPALFIFIFFFLKLKKKRFIKAINLICKDTWSGGKFNVNYKSMMTSIDTPLSEVQIKEPQLKTSRGVVKFVLKVSIEWVIQYLFHKYHLDKKILGVRGEGC